MVGCLFWAICLTLSDGTVSVGGFSGKFSYNQVFLVGRKGSFPGLRFPYWTGSSIEAVFGEGFQERKKAL